MQIFGQIREKLSRTTHVQEPVKQKRPVKNRSYWTNEAIAAYQLLETGEISTKNSLAGFRMPGETKLRRNTRLAATIFDLRADGWVIETVEESGKPSKYRLVSAGTMPLLPNTFTWSSTNAS